MTDIERVPIWDHGATPDSLEVMIRVSKPASSVHIRVIARNGLVQRVAATWTISSGPVATDIVAEVETVASACLEQLLDRRWGVTPS